MGLYELIIELRRRTEALSQLTGVINALDKFYEEYYVIDEGNGTILQETQKLRDYLKEERRRYAKSLSLYSKRVGVATKISKKR
jgi:hypothetical protein